MRPDWSATFSGEIMAQYETYTVQSGDTLSKIAQAKGVSTADLVALNALRDPDLINPGQVLSIRRLSETIHVVQRGDTLSAIAAHYGVALPAVIAANGITDPHKLDIGQRIAIPSPGDAPPRPGPAPAPVPVTPRAGLPQPGAASLKAAEYAERRATGRRSVGLCYRWVKQALQHGGAVDEYLGGASAINAGPQLLREGYVEILHGANSGIKSPYDAPCGAVLVYRAAATATDKNRIHGHIEIRTANGFASDYFSPRARTGPRENGLTSLGAAGRTLDGVYVKPEAGPVAASPAPVATPAAAPPAPPAAGGAADPFGPANLALGVNGLYEGAILEAAQRTGLAPQTVASIINAEAAKDRTGRWDANSKAGSTTASGLTQFLKRTWLGEAVRRGGLLNVEAKAAGVVSAQDKVVDEARLLGLRFDPRLSILAGADYGRANLASMKAAGVVGADVGPAGLAKLAYLAHHEGPGTAVKLLKGNMAYVTPKQFSDNVPDAARRANYVAAAGGNLGLGYRAWLAEYTDKNIDVRKFMKDSGGIVVPAVSSFYR